MHRWYHHFVDCLPFISVLLSLFSSAVYISSSILCSSPLYSRELCTCFAVCLVYLNSLSNRVLQLFSPPSSEFDSPLAFSPPIPLHCIGPPQLPPPLHAHTTLSHSTTQPFATLLLSTPARLVSRIQIKSINHLHGHLRLQCTNHMVETGALTSYSLCDKLRLYLKKPQSWVLNVEGWNLQING